MTPKNLSQSGKSHSCQKCIYRVIVCEVDARGVAARAAQLLTLWWWWRGRLRGRGPWGNEGPGGHFWGQDPTAPATPVRAARGGAAPRRRVGIGVTIDVSVEAHWKEKHTWKVLHFASFLTSHGIHWLPVLLWLVFRNFVLYL